MRNDEDLMERIEKFIFIYHNGIPALILVLSFFIFLFIFIMIARKYPHPKYILDQFKLWLDIIH